MDLREQHLVKSVFVEDVLDGNRDRWLERADLYYQSHEHCTIVFPTVWHLVEIVELLHLNQ